MPAAADGNDSDDDTKKLNEEIANMAALKKQKKEEEEAERLSKLGTNITSGGAGAGVLMLTTKVRVIYTRYVYMHFLHKDDSPISNVSVRRSPAMRRTFPRRATLAVFTTSAP